SLCQRYNPITTPNKIIPNRMMVTLFIGRYFIGTLVGASTFHRIICGPVERFRLYTVAYNNWPLGDGGGHRSSSSAGNPANDEVMGKTTGPIPPFSLCMVASLRGILRQSTL